MVINMSTGSPVYTMGIEKYGYKNQCMEVRDAMLTMEKEELLRRFVSVGKGNYQLEVRCIATAPGKPLRSSDQ